jgi:hypothetical protein
MILLNLVIAPAFFSFDIDTFNYYTTMSESVIYIHKSLANLHNFIFVGLFRSFGVEYRYFCVFQVYNSPYTDSSHTKYVTHNLFAHAKALLVLAPNWVWSIASTKT